MENFHFRIIACFLILSFSVKALKPQIQPRQLSGNLSPNNLLQNARFIRANGLKGPESIAFDSRGHLYTGLSSGKIVRLNRNNRSIIDRVYYIGEETNQDICSKILILLIKFV